MDTNAAILLGAMGFAFACYARAPGQTRAVYAMESFGPLTGRQKDHIAARIPGAAFGSQDGRITVTVPLRAA